MRSLDTLRVGLKKDGSLSNGFSMRDEADCRRMAGVRGGMLSSLGERRPQAEGKALAWTD